MRERALAPLLAPILRPTFVQLQLFLLGRLRQRCFLFSSIYQCDLDRCAVHYFLYFFVLYNLLGTNSDFTNSFNGDDDGDVFVIPTAGGASATGSGGIPVAGGAGTTGSGNGVGGGRRRLHPRQDEVQAQHHQTRPQNTQLLGPTRYLANKRI